MAGGLFAQADFTVQGHPRPDIQPNLRAAVSTYAVNEEDTNFTFDDITFWVGEGENRAALVIDWYGKDTPTMVWGFKWTEGTKATGFDMVKAIAKADPRFLFFTHFTGGMGNTIAGFGYNLKGSEPQYLLYNGEKHYPNEGVVYTTAYNYDDWTSNDQQNLWVSGWTRIGYWSYQVKDSQEATFGYSGLGASSRVLKNGSWDGWGFQYFSDPSYSGVIPRAPWIAAAGPAAIEPVAIELLKDEEPVKETVTLKAHGTLQLSSNVLTYSDISSQLRTAYDITWLSTNDAVATVDESGLVTAHTGGKCEIVAVSGLASGVVTLDVPLPSPLPNYTSYWSEMGKNSNHLALVETRLARTADELTEKWKTLLTNSWMNGGQPLIVNGNVYLALNNEIMILDAVTGEIKKKNTMGGSCGYFSMIAYGEGKIFVPMNSGLLQAFNAETLEPLWQTETHTGYQHVCQVVYYDGYVYTGKWKGGSTGVYYCVSAEDEDPYKTNEIKAVTWESDNTGFYWSGGTIVDDVIIFGGDSGILQSRNRLTGELVDSYQIAPELTTSTIRCGSSYDPVMKRIYFTGKESKKIYSVKINEDGTFDNQSILSSNVTGQSTTVPTVYNGRVYATSGTMTSGGGLDVFDATTLERIYAVDLGGISQSTPLLTTAYATEANNYTVYLYVCLNNANGSIVCVKDFQGNTEPLVQFTYIPSSIQYCTHSLVADENGTLYYKNDAKYLFALETNSIDVINVELNIEEDPDPVQVGGTFELSAIITPENATYKDITWTSSNPEVATVSAKLARSSAQGNSVIVTAHSEGTTVITASADDGSFSAATTFSVSGVTGINKDESSTIMVYPTVTRDVVYVSAQSNQTAVVLDMTGKVLQTVNVFGRDSKISLDSYPAGIYFVKVGTSVFKVIKK